MSNNEKTTTLSVITKALEKEYGHIVKWLSEAADYVPETISTGCLGLDAAIGNGGFERGLIAELFGPRGSGKSFLGYSTIREACKKGHKCAIIDAENSLDPGLLVRVGLPLDRVLIIGGAPTGEANLEIADNLMSTGELAVVMIDSVAALVPDSRVESSYDQHDVGAHARLMSKGIQKILPVVKKTNTLLIFINQIRNKIGTYGNPETTTGGEALPFYAAYRVQIRGGQSKASRLADKITGQIYGHKTDFFVDKNKRHAPYRTAEVDLIYGEGYDTLGEVVDLGIDLGLINQEGSWFSYNEVRWQGRENAKVALRENTVLYQGLHDAIKSLITGTPVKSAPTEVENTEEAKDDKRARQKR